MRALIYRSGAIGDIIQCLPAIKAYKQLNPDIRLDLIIDIAPLKALLELAAPYIDHIYVGRKLKSSVELLESLQDQPVNHFFYLHSTWWKAILMKQQHFPQAKLSIFKKDISVSAQENYARTFGLELTRTPQEMRKHESILISSSCKLKEDFLNKITADNNPGHEKTKYKDTTSETKPSHKKAKREDINSETNINNVQTSISTHSDLKFSDKSLEINNKKTTRLKLLDHHNLDASKLTKSKLPKNPYLVIIPGVGQLRPLRAYPLPIWEELIHKILKEMTYEIVILGGKDEFRLSLEMNIDMRLRHPCMKRVHNLIGKTDLVRSAYLISQAKQVISADTGMLHLADSLDVPTISVFSITSAERTGVLKPDAITLRSKYCTCAAKKDFNANKLKTCTKIRSGYPACIWDISARQVTELIKN
jgi:ADP-heptose:LPS heptosyltransferase